MSSSISDQRRTRTNSWFSRLSRSKHGLWIVVAVATLSTVTLYWLAVAGSRANPMRAVYLSNVRAAGERQVEWREFAQVAIGDPDFTILFFAGWAGGWLWAGLIVFCVNARYFRVATARVAADTDSSTVGEVHVAERHSSAATPRGGSAKRSSNLAAYLLVALVLAGLVLNMRWTIAAVTSRKPYEKYLHEVWAVASSQNPAKDAAQLERHPPGTWRFFVNGWMSGILCGSVASWVILRDERERRSADGKI